MRRMDNDKRAALLKSALGLINEHGFEAAPMSKIAKIAGVSPATIYLHFKNKEDMINTLYLELKANLGEIAFEGFEEEMPVRDGFELIWYNIAKYKMREPSVSLFLTQCDTAPLIHEESKMKGTEYLRPLFNLWQKGQKEGLIKQVSLYLIYAYSIHPFSFLLESQNRKKYTLTEENLNEAFNVAWDAIKVETR